MCRGLEQQGVHDIVGGTNHTLGLAVLSRSVGARHMKLNAVGEKERTRGGVVELAPVVTLNGLNGTTKLSGHPGEEVRERLESIGFQAQRKSSGVMRKIIHNHQVEFISRYTENGRGP